MDITLKEKENRQNEFAKYINQLRQWNKSEEKNEKTNINRLYNSRQNVIQMLNDYIKTIFKAQQKAEQPKEQPNTTDMSDLESKESAAPRKSETEKGHKILTPNQVIIIFSIALAQVQARNNSQKFKNEIRRLLNFLCHWKEIIKSIYNNLIKAT